jgi:hypothetical protein
MISFRRRRAASSAIALAGLGLLGGVAGVLDMGLHDVAYPSGWLLLGLVVLLAAFNVRKRLSFVPLGSASTWLQLHIYAGLVALGVFGMHVDWRLPNGFVEVALAASFLLVAASGVVGLILTRTIPSRATTRGEALLHERIPQIIARLRGEAEEVVVQASIAGQSRLVANFHRARLAWFFARPRYLMRHFLESDRPLRLLQDEIRSLERYATPAEVRFLERLSEMVRKKSDLDYHYALQGVLKGWLFVHIPLTSALVLLCVLHIVLVHAFAVR